MNTRQGFPYKQTGELPPVTENLLIFYKFGIYYKKSPPPPPTNFHSSSKK